MTKRFHEGRTNTEMVSSTVAEKLPYCGGVFSSTVASGLLECFNSHIS